MHQIINESSIYRNNLSSVRSPTTDQSMPLPPSLKIKSATKPLKLHSSDIAYLKILEFFHTKSGKTYLTKAQWPIYLVRFGGKPIHYQKQKERWAKMRKLGYIETSRYLGNRNKELDHFITAKGLAALKAYIEKIKNGTSKLKKRYPGKKKTVPPLSHVQFHENKHEKALEKLSAQDYEKAATYKRLMNVGFYPEVIKKVMDKYSRLQIYEAYNLTMERKVKNKGAYMYQLLKLLYS